MTPLLWIAFGSALGGVARYACSLGAARLLGSAFPWGTLLVNIVGCTFIGAFASLTQAQGRYPWPTTLRQFVMIGICGGFTTFSSFSLETLTLARDGFGGKALAYAALSLLLCLAGVWLGAIAANSINQRG